MASKQDTPHRDNLIGAAVLVIGGTSGIGFAVASAAINASADVFVSSSSAEKVDRAVARLRDLYPAATGATKGPTIAGAAADLSDVTKLNARTQEILDAAVHALGRPLDHIVVTAGGPPPRIPLAEFDPTKALDYATLRLMLPMSLASCVARHPGVYLRAASSSSLTLTSGVLVKKPLPGMASTIFFGGALDTIRRSLSHDLAPIRTNVITPGVVETELVAKFSGMIEKWKEQTTVKEIGSAADVAEAYLYCMRCKFAVAEEIIVDGGTMLF